MTLTLNHQCYTLKSKQTQRRPSVQKVAFHRILRNTLPSQEVDLPCTGRAAETWRDVLTCPCSQAWSIQRPGLATLSSLAVPRLHRRS